MYAIFFKSRGFQDFKYDMDMDMSDMDVNVNTQFHIFMDIVNLRVMLWYMCENSWRDWYVVGGLEIIQVSESIVVSSLRMERHLTLTFTSFSH